MPAKLDVNENKILAPYVPRIHPVVDYHTATAVWETADGTKEFDIRVGHVVRGSAGEESLVVFTRFIFEGDRPTTAHLASGAESLRFGK